MPRIIELPEAIEIDENIVFPIEKNAEGNTEKVKLNSILKKTEEQTKRLIREYTPVYGVKRTLTSTSTEWLRTDDSVGLVANATKDGSPVANDFDNIYPWSDIITVNYDNEAKKIVAEYGDSNFKFDGTNGEVMTMFPEFWIERKQTATEESIRISSKKFGDAVRIAPFMMGRYTTSSGVHSLSGVTSTVSQTRNTFRTQAEGKGDGWSIVDAIHIFAIEYLYLVEYANANSQNMLGQGVCSVSTQVTLGECDSLGMKSGCKINGGGNSMIYRGLENIFGNIWQFVDGINIKDYVTYICTDQNDFADDKFDFPYVEIGYTNANTNGNPNKMGYDANNPLVGINVQNGTSVYGDYYWQNSGNRIAFFGGGWANGSSGGLFCWNLDNDSGLSGASVGARLLLTLF